jgi:hypothetical protein
MAVRRFTSRIGQGLRALFAFALPVDTPAVQSRLSPALYALFCRMARSEQIHAIRVMRWLQARGHDHPDLLTAALLHDVGKSRYGITLPGRVIASLVLNGSRSAYRYYCAAVHLQPRGLHRPFVIATQHPVWSAEDMAAAGASDLAVWLARHHAVGLASPPASERDHLLAALMAADNEH